MVPWHAGSRAYDPETTIRSVLSAPTSATLLRTSMSRIRARGLARVLKDRVRPGQSNESQPAPGNSDRQGLFQVALSRFAWYSDSKSIGIKTGYSPSKKQHSVEAERSLHGATQPPPRGETRSTRRGAAYTARKSNAAYTARRSLHGAKKRYLHGATAKRSQHGATQPTRS